SSPASNTWTTLGWQSRAARRASCTNRRRKPSFPARCSARTFTATTRPRSVSRASSTAPMAPCPIRRSTRYRPPRCSSVVMFGAVSILLSLGVVGTGPGGLVRGRRGGRRGRRGRRAVDGGDDPGRPGQRLGPHRGVRLHGGQVAFQRAGLCQRLVAGPGVDVGGDPVGPRRQRRGGVGGNR